MATTFLWQRLNGARSLRQRFSRCAPAFVLLAHTRACARHRCTDPVACLPQVVERRNLSGVTLDYEGAVQHSANVATLAQFTETWSTVAKRLHAGTRRRELGFCISSSIDEKAGENATRYGSDYLRQYGYPNIYGDGYRNYIPFADVFTDMSTYPFGNFTGATVSYLDALITAMLKHGVNASTGQLSPGIWLGECIDGISTRTPGGKYGGGWARADLHNFLKFLDEHSVRSVDIWTSDGRNKTSCPSPCPSTPTCQWAYEELRAWKTGRH